MKPITKDKLIIEFKRVYKKEPIERELKQFEHWWLEFKTRQDFRQIKERMKLAKLK